MNEPGSDLTRLGVNFATLSLLAIGGMNAVVPEMHRQAVEVARWTTERQFADLYALSQITPGPNALLVTLIGFHVAGIAGALLATAAMIGPSCLLTYVAARTWQRFEQSRGRATLQASFVPLSLGLIAASALVLARTVDVSFLAVLITLGTAITTFFSRTSPLWMFALAAVLGYAGLV